MSPDSSLHNPNIKSISKTHNPYYSSHGTSPNTQTYSNVLKTSVNKLQTSLQRDASSKKKYVFGVTICLLVLIVVMVVNVSSIIHWNNDVSLVNNPNIPQVQSISPTTSMHATSPVSNNANVPQVQSTSPAVADFTVSVTYGVAPLKVTFTDESQNTDVSGSKISYNFGKNEGSSSEKNPSHIYNYPGTYTVIQTVWNPFNSEPSSKTFKITVTNPLKANFNTAVTDMTVKFIDTSTGTPTKWTWNFGDGQTSNEQNPQYTYTSPGTYTVNLAIGNNDGSTDTVTKQIIVTSP